MPENIYEGEDVNAVLPEWQGNIIDRRLAEIEAHPERLRPIEELFEELDRD